MRLFGELSDLSEENMRSIPYDEYFDEMDLTEEEKEKRKQFYAFYFYLIFRHAAVREYK